MRRKADGKLDFSRAAFLLEDDAHKLDAARGQLEAEEEQTKVYADRLTIQVTWLPTNASWLDQIEIWFSVLQRKLLQPNHFLSTDQLEQAILDFIAYYDQTAKPIKWSYTVEKLEHKLGVN